LMTRSAVSTVDTVHECDGQTDRQNCQGIISRFDAMYRASKTVKFTKALRFRGTANATTWYIIDTTVSAQA